MNNVLGIDIGATGIKGAIVDIETGAFVTDRIKYDTPVGGKPKEVRAVIGDLINDFQWKGPVGCGFPGIIKDGTVSSTANVSNRWMGIPVEDYFSDKCGVPFVVANDADLAGVAEMNFGKGKGVKGTLIFITIGTGLGSAIFVDGKLVPNTEMGHLLYKDSVFEHYASNSARKNKNLSWENWAIELSIYLDHLDLLFTPTIILLGGGISKKFDRWGKYLQLETNVAVDAAALKNNAGIIGAAMLAYEKLEKKEV